MLNPAEEHYYRNTVNDFGIDNPKTSRTNHFSVATSGSWTFGLSFIPVGYVTVRINNFVLPNSDYSVVGSTLTIIPALNIGDQVIVVGDTA